MNRACTEEQFLKDVAEHKMSVVRDEGMFRVLHFKKDKTICGSFSLVTWPGYLCITGDMGTYVFSRLDDMFHFFRREEFMKNKPGLQINLSYWAEKLQAIDKTGKVKEYSYDIFKQIVQERIDEAETTKVQRDAVEDMVANLDGQPIEIVHERIRDFEEFEFSDFWEHDLTEHTYHFVWCCFAIAWGIQEYDKSKL